MNFLFHFELCARDSGSERSAAGAMLPDLWRMAARPARARRDVALESAVADPALAAILAGVSHHLRIDAWFHKTEFFSAGEAAATRALAATGSKRMGLFGHVVWEMCLDGALVRMLGEQALASRVRDALSGAGEAMHRAADLHHHAARERAGIEPAQFRSRMDRLIGAVSSFELPAGYARAEGVALRTRGIRAMFGMEQPSASELARWQQAIETLEPLADEAAAAITSRTSCLCSAP